MVNTVCHGKLVKNRTMKNSAEFPGGRELFSTVGTRVQVWGSIANKLLQQVVLVSSLVTFCLPQPVRGASQYWANGLPSGTWHSSFWTLAADGTGGQFAWNDGNSAVFSASSAGQTNSYSVTLDSNVIVQNLTYTGGNKRSHVYRGRGKHNYHE
jgi:hypothetical protein